MTEQGNSNLLQVEMLSVQGLVLRLESVRALKVKLQDNAWLGILPGHAPLIAATAEGLMHYETAEGAQTVEIKPSVLSVKDNLVSLLSTY